MWSHPTLHKLNNPPPKRTVWADKTKELLAVIAEKQQALTEEVKRLKAECNHTYPSGESAIVEEEVSDGPGPWDYSRERRCTACGCRC